MNREWWWQHSQFLRCFLKGMTELSNLEHVSRKLLSACCSGVDGIKTDGCSLFFFIAYLPHHPHQMSSRDKERENKVSREFRNSEHCLTLSGAGQSQKNHGSVVALLSGKFLQIRKVFATRHIFAQNCQVGKETVWMTKILSGQSTNCPDNIETVRIIQKLSGQPKNCQDNIETVRIIQKHSWQLKNCPDNSKTIRTI